MTSSPYLSAIVSTCQRHELLSQCLKNLAPGKQTLAAEHYEVIVSDDGRTNTAKHLIEEKFPWAKWLEGPKRGPAANRNNGAKSAQGKWLAFIDDDCIPSQNWLEAIYDEAKRGEVEVIEGKTERSTEVDRLFFYGVENKDGGIFLSCNLAIRKDVFFAIGAFDEDFLEAGGEDTELAYRIQSEHKPFIFLKSAVVTHPVRHFNLRTLIWRAKLTRWILLYRLKTGQAVSLNESNVKALIALTYEFWTNLVRSTWHYFGKGPHKYSKGRFFELMWNIISAPIVLPYLWIWELRFRKMLSERDIQRIN